MITVTNGFKTNWSGIYLGRGGKGKAESALANPFKLEDFDTRENCIKAFREWLWLQMMTETPQRQEIRRLAKLHLQGANLQLDCFCAPKACHGDVIKSCILWYCQNQICFYTGVGSRKVPPQVAAKMSDISQQRDESDWILRSGGAKGSDYAFELAATNALYSFRTDSFFTKVNEFRYNAELWLEAEKLARSVHPIFDKLEPYIKKLHTRNVFQVLGENLDRPSYDLICWTDDGADGSKKKCTRETGGTATAIKIANMFNVPVMNLKNELHN